MPGRGTIDIKRLGTALTQAGIDPRHWASYGTVATVDDDGTPDFTDRKAVYIGPQGVECDVLLEPIGIAVVALYAGIAGGRETSFFSPIKPGDRVLVVLPDGDPTVTPVIAAVLHSAHDRMPTEGGKPIFQNDRMLLFLDSVDLDVRTKNGATLTVQQDGTVTATAAHVNLGGADASEQLIEGTGYRAAENSLLTSGTAAGLPVNLLDAFDKLQAAAVGPLAPLKVGFLEAQAALQAFKLSAQAASDWLSEVSKTK